MRKQEEEKTVDRKGPLRPWLVDVDVEDVRPERRTVDTAASQQWLSIKERAS